MAPSLKQDLVAIGLILILLIGVSYYVFVVKKQQVIEMANDRAAEDVGKDSKIVETVEVPTCNDTCIYEGAISKRDVTLCDTIQQTDLKESCITTITRQDILRRSVMENNVLVCDELENDLRTGCYDNFYYVKALTTGDKSNCQKIFDESTRNECAN